ncbi:MAG: C10 family peptidase, partial [Armatimonadota bacterium]
VILDSAWHQYWPYNDQCPNLGCTDPDLNARALVGCVATAAAQIMRHWRWPPECVGGDYADPYDWPNMAATVSGSSTQAEIDTVAELGHEVGVACSMDYGCEGSGAYHDDMVSAYENNFRYSTLAIMRKRDDYTAVEWFERMKTQFNVNRPVQYGIPGHSLVSDGWRESGSPVVREYHFNYGWRSAGYNTWYVLDALPGGNPDDEEMIENIKPNCCIGSAVGGPYIPPSYPYRYFDQDATCSVSATFYGGHRLQFLHNVTLTCTSTTGYLYIYGTTADNTRLFARGDPTRGVLLSGSTIKMSNGAQIVFR